MTSHLERHRERQSGAQFRRQVTFGLALGWILVLVGGAYAFFVPFSLGGLWTTVFAVGVALLMTSMLRPTAMEPVERLFRNLTQPIGNFIFKSVLTIVYYLVITPAGRLMGSGEQFYNWQSPEQAPQETAWVERGVPQTRVGPSGAPLGYRVLAAFVSRSNAAMLPAVLILVLGGLLMFFLETSAFAPFIYTLF